MVTPTPGTVVLFKFPFSGNPLAQLRPALVLAGVGGAWILCQITADPYGDPQAIRLTDADFASGSLRRISYARPGKLFTANAGLMVSAAGKLRVETLRRVMNTVLGLLRSGSGVA